MTETRESRITQRNREMQVCAQRSVSVDCIPVGLCASSSLVHHEK